MVLERDWEIYWTYRVKNEEKIKWVKEERNILRGVKWKYTNVIGDVLRSMCLLKRVTE